LSDTPIEQLGFPKDLPREALPALTWRVISRLPFVVIGVGLGLSAIFRWRSREGAHE
jgi:formate dehydrogenase iron-sulfur subunit